MICALFAEIANVGRSGKYRRIAADCSGRPNLSIDPPVPPAPQWPAYNAAAISVNNGLSDHHNPPFLRLAPASAGGWDERAPARAQLGSEGAGCGRGTGWNWRGHGLSRTRASGR